MNLFWQTFLVVSVSKLFICFAGCPSAWHSQNESYFYLSENQTDAETAAGECLSHGASLSEFISGYFSPPFIKFLDNKYCKNLRNVWAFTNDYNFLYSETPSISNNEFKYTNLSFHLYSKQTGTYTKKVNFCNAPNASTTKWLINSFPLTCKTGWANRFSLYGGTSDSLASKKLYHYQNLKYSSKLSYNENDVKGMFKESLPLYVPDISVFTGVRSEIGQTKWFTDNKTLVKELSHVSSREDICQQMSLNYNSNNKWILSTKRCTGDIAHYMCQLKFKPSLKTRRCNANVVELTWNSSLFDHVMSLHTKLTIKVSVTTKTSATFSRLYTNNFRLGAITMANLNQRTDYQVNITVMAKNCDSLVSSTANIETGYGVPDPVTSAVVLNQLYSASNECYIKWSKSASDENILGYKVTADTGKNVFTTEKELSQLSVQNAGSLQIIKILVPINHLETNQTISFEIQAYSCQGFSVKGKVVGHCVTPVASLLSILKSQYAGIIVSVVLLVAVILLVFGFCVKKRRKKKRFEENKSQTVSISTQRQIPRIIHNRSPPSIPVTPDTYQDYIDIVESRYSAYSKRMMLYENIAGSGGIDSETGYLAMN